MDISESYNQHQIVIYHIIIFMILFLNIWLVIHLLCHWVDKSSTRINGNADRSVYGYKTITYHSNDIHQWRLQIINGGKCIVIRIGEANHKYKKAIFYSTITGLLTPLSYGLCINRTFVSPKEIVNLQRDMAWVI